MYLPGYETAAFVSRLGIKAEPILNEHSVTRGWSGRASPIVLTHGWPEIGGQGNQRAGRVRTAIRQARITAPLERLSPGKTDGGASRWHRGESRNNQCH